VSLVLAAGVAVKEAGAGAVRSTVRVDSPKMRA